MEPDQYDACYCAFKTYAQMAHEASGETIDTPYGELSIPFFMMTRGGGLFWVGLRGNEVGVISLPPECLQGSS